MGCDGDEDRCKMQHPVMMMMELDWCICNAVTVIHASCEADSRLVRHDARLNGLVLLA